MQMNQYQAMAQRTINPALDKSELIYHALHGMASEVGELHGLYQKSYQGHELEEEHLKKEVGDLMWFIAEFCTAYGWMLEDIARMNIDKLKARYPENEGFTAERSLHRREGDI